MSQRSRWLIGLFAFAVMVLPARADEVEVSDRAPEIHGGKWYNADGAVSLAKLRDRIVLLDFWATY